MRRLEVVRSTIAMLALAAKSEVRTEKLVNDIIVLGRDLLEHWSLKIRRRRSWASAESSPAETLMNASEFPSGSPRS